MSQTRKFAFDVGWVLISSAVNLIIAFSLRIVLARWLGSTDLGLYTMVVSFQEVAALAAGLGISMALVKYVAEYQATKDKLSEVISSSFTISLIFGLATGILLYFLSPALANLFNMPQLAHLLKIIAIAFPFNALVEAELGLFNGLRKMKTFTFLIVTRTCLMMLFIIIFIWSGFGVKGTAFGILFSIIVTSIWGLYLSRQYLHLSFNNFLKNTKTLVIFGSQIFGANAVNYFANQMDTLMIGYFLTATEVGYYSVAVTICMLFAIIPNAVRRISYPATTEYWYKEDRWSLQKMIDKSMKYTACILLPVGLVFGFFAKGIIGTVFGADFLYSVPPLLVMLVSRVLRGATINPVSSAFTGMGRPDIGLKVDTFSLLLNFGLNMLFIPRYGILGAAISSTVSLLVGTAIYIVLLPRMLGVKIDARWFGLAIGTSALAVTIFWIGTQFISTYIAGGIILAAFLILIFRYLLTKDDKVLFKSLAYSLIKRG